MIEVVALLNSSERKAAKAAANVKASIRYLISFQAEHSYQGRRYYWTICQEDNPDRLVAWGYSLTQEMAETAAENEVKALSSGLSEGGHVIDTGKPVSQRRHCVRRS